MKKKPIYIFILICSSFINLTTFAQKIDSTFKQITEKDTTKSSQSKDLIRTANNLKSGNWQDVLTSFFQLGLQDIASSNHSFSFKANLFAIQAKADSTLLIDTNYTKHKFSRNFQFDFSLKLDSAYRFNGFKGGITWAIVNKRDSTIVHFANDYSRQFNDILINHLNTFFVSHHHKLLDSTGNVIKDEKGHAVFVFNTKEDSILYINTSKVVTQMKDSGYFSAKLVPKEFGNLFILDSLFKKADSVFQNNLSNIAKQPLITFSANGNFDKVNSKLSGGEYRFVWLQGFLSKAYSSSNGSSCESDFRLFGNTKDTIINSSSLRRTYAGGTWGLNIIAIRKNKSIFEFKPNIEYSHIFKGGINGEEKNNFFANADFRVRITDNLWVPFTIKYDLKKKNFLGFLNIAFNMSAFKISKS